MQFDARFYSVTYFLEFRKDSTMKTSVAIPHHRQAGRNPPHPAKIPRSSARKRRTLSDRAKNGELIYWGETWQGLIAMTASPVGPVVFVPAAGAAVPVPEVVTQVNFC